ncbi:MAG TPA: DapH/DapD/GlmU-related protein, partial [Acidiferrobacteraceae bacterium]|nr:DapH/DapD/GlmU-related protein [Acidiferrobacteraceae bacterium]
GELQGVNHMADLAAVERALQRRHAATLMHAGVQLLDPARFDLRGTLRAGRDVRIDVGVVLEGDVVLGANVYLGPYVQIRDCVIEDGARIEAHSVLEGAQVAAGAVVGPFARLRPGARLGAGSRVGNFVEIKKSDLGPGTKVNHLSYIGDAEVGARVNIGAGVITCNYDGVRKHRTRIGDDASIGADTQLVAPVAVGPGATIGAGSTITEDAPEGTLTLSRVRQKSVPGWKRPRKPE